MDKNKKSEDTKDTTTSEAIASIDLEDIPNVSPIAVREDTKDTQTWTKLETSAIVLPTTLKPNDSKDSSVAVSQCYSMLPTATKSYKEEFETFKELYYKEVNKVKQLTEENNTLLQTTLEQSAKITTLENNQIQLTNKIQQLEAKESNPIKEVVVIKKDYPDEL